MALFKRRKQQEEVARVAWSRLGEEARRPIKTEAHRQAWKELVAAVGTNAAVEHVEVAAAIGMADAMRAAVEMVLADFDRGLLSAEEALADVNALGDEFIPRLDDQIGVQILAATSDDYPLVASAAHGLAEGMVKAATTIANGEFTSEAEAEWIRDQRTYEYHVSKWDRESGRPRLPLVGGS